MSNMSLNKEPVFLNEGKQYFVIDALYLMDIKDQINLLELKNIDSEIREKIFAFPCTNTPFGKYKANKKEFKISQIRKAFYNEAQLDKESYFSTDTGLILIIAENVFIDFIKSFEYSELVDSSFELINKKYWELQTSKFGFGDIALILSPGINSGEEFDGSGTYQLIN